MIPRPRRRLEAVGYWFNDAAPSHYPRVQRLVGRWQAARRERVVAYLRAGTIFETYPSSSFCRFGCGASARVLGRCDVSDGIWVWPEGLAHYLEAHSVRLPERFVRRASAARVDSLAIPRDHAGLIDDTQWIAWGRERGAHIDLTGWTVPSWARQRAFAKRLAAAINGRGVRSTSVVDRGHVLRGESGAVVLVRADGRAVVVTLTRGRLAIVRLDARATTRVLSGWQDWRR